MYFYGCCCSAVVCKTLWSECFFREEICITEAALEYIVCLWYKFNAYLFMSDQLSCTTLHQQDFQIREVTQVGLIAALNCFSSICLQSIGYATSVQCANSCYGNVNYIYIYCLQINIVWSKLVLCILHVERAFSRVFWMIPFNPIWRPVIQHYLTIFTMCLSLLSKRLEWPTQAHRQTKH